MRENGGVFFLSAKLTWCASSCATTSATRTLFASLLSFSSSTRLVSR